MNGDFWVWRVGGEAYALDFLDAKDVARYRAAVAEWFGDTSVQEVHGVIMGFCGRLRGFFDALFGEGAGVRLVGGTDNLRVAVGVYRDFLDFGARQGEAARAMLEEAVWRYDPARALRGEGAGDA